MVLHRVGYMCYADTQRNTLPLHKARRAHCIAAYILNGHSLHRKELGRTGRVYLHGMVWYTRVHRLSVFDRIVACIPHAWFAHLQNQAS